MPQHLVKKYPRERGLLVPLVLVISLIALGVGCGIEKAIKNNYQFWNKFIDGIPDPNAPKVAGLAYEGADPETFIEHAPFADESCQECHRNPAQSRLTIEDSQICLKCHEEKPTEFALMHGPVAVGACLWCHDPHSSPLPHLLRAPTPDICLQCHALEGTVGPHADQEASTRSCLDCHLGHGGTDTYYLLPEETRPSLKTEPSPPENDPETAPLETTEPNAQTDGATESSSAAELSKSLTTTEGMGG